MQGRYKYTNSVDAMEYNYNLGHRVFEIDFQLTKDGKLAAVHNWQDSVPTLSEFKKQKIYGKFTPTDIDDVIGFLSRHKDSFLILDTKDIDLEVVKKQYTEIYNSAIKIDSNVFKRIIPQFYTPMMLAEIDKIYKFNSVIYVLYVKNPVDKFVIDFVKKEDRVQVITMWDHRANKNFIDSLSSIGKRVYVHTVNDSALADSLEKLGVYGFYTDFLLPH